MKIVRAATLGFCFGVRRAVDLADEAARNAANSSGKVYTFGPLIHNPQVLEDLKRRGVETLDESTLPPNLHGASIIIRAHGLSPQLEAKLRETGAKIIDATCPRVKASQLKAAAFASAFAADGYRLFLAGEEHHAEIAGIRGYAGDAFYAVAGNAAEAKVLAQRLLAQDSGAKTALIGQTTISPEEYMAIGHAITPFFPDLEIAQTICAATKERQDALRQILDKVDAVIIAGGKDSANTRRLLAIAETAGKPCAIAETAEDIPAEFFSLATVGLASGASTPDAVIDNIAGYISKKYALC